MSNTIAMNSGSAVAATPQSPVQVTGISGRRRLIRRMMASRVTMVSLVFLFLVVGITSLAWLIAPHEPNAQDLSAVFAAPSQTHWLGTDRLGRDALSRLIYGARVTLIAGLESTAIALVIGIPIGMIAGFGRRSVDRAIMLVNDGLMSLPGIILAIAIVGSLGPGLTNAMAAIGIVFAPRVVRLVRSETLGIREQDYIGAAQIIGMGTPRILLRLVLPNIRSTVIVYATLIAARAMLSEASLSFLGLGAQYPESSWGSMLAESFQHIGRAPLLVVAPGVCIAAVVLALNLLSDGLRDATGREIRT